ncbi:alpha/beta hydrolase family protein [Nocardia sp. NPDC050697]|uniref:alpha/beta hydrolase n=1 Tax=Nocardia sp. NPDC050697 TaxID=3155158 RepID=UPI0033F2B67F
MRHRYFRATLALLTAATAVLLTTAPAAAQPEPHVVAREPLGDRASRIDVYSPSMDRVISTRVLHAATGPAPTLYLLTGLGGGQDGISWWHDTDARAFFADKRVDVVLPFGGAYSMYTDWRADDPALGRNRWQTFLTEELPAALATELESTGRAAVAGVSMSAGSALDLAIQAPGRYAAVAAYSGCPWSADPSGVVGITAQVTRGGGNPANMWGPLGGPGWQAHDAYTYASALRGTAIYLSAASGAPGAIDRGAAIPPVEALARGCTAAFARLLAALGIPATHVDRPQGAHTWGQFETDLHESWPLLAAALE